jgi:hypothetical protein
MSAQKGKLPPHMVLSQKLMMATVDISKEHPANEAVVKALLDTLFRSEMKASDAHGLVQSLCLLYDRVNDAGQEGLVEMVDQVIEDLRGRRDEAKPEAPVAPVTLASGIPNFPHT